jgi:N-acetylglucosamine-6-phosphate deacetylase
MKLRGRIGANKEIVDLLIEGGRIVEIAAANPSQAADLGDENLRMSAGFIDLQVNGYGGIDFNDPKTTTDQMIELTRPV